MTRENPEVLCARLDHLSKVEGLWRAIAKECNPNDETAPSQAVEGLNRALQDFNFLESESFWLLLAQIDGRPVGYLTAVRIPKADERMGVLYIDELYVLNEYRRCGAGSALIGEVCRIGQELGFWRVRLNADQGNAEVCAFYEGNGFEHSGDGFFQKGIRKKSTE